MKKSVTKMAKILSVILAGIMLVSMLGGCSPTKTDESGSNDSNVSNSEQIRSYPYKFTDMAGKEITLEKEVKSVYIVGSVQPLVALYRYYAGNSDNLLGCPAASQSIIKSSVFAEIWPDILNVASHNDDVNVEEILALKPDVVFMTGNASGDEYEALVNAGLKVVCFTTASAGNDSDTFETVKNWLNQMGEVFGDKKSAENLISYNTEALKEIDAKLSNVKAEDKPNALIVFQLTDNSLKVAGSGHYSEFWLSHTGANNAAASVDKIQEVDMEQLMAWNPDIIYLTTFSPAMPEDLYGNKIKGFDFSQLNAVKNKKVYKIPLGSYRWYAPSCECALMLKWMAKTNHPQAFEDVKIETEISEFIEKFYGKKPDENQIKALLNPSDKSLMSH